MNLIELNRALRQLRLGGMAGCAGDPSAASPSGTDGTLRLPLLLVSDELARRGERLLERRRKQAQFWNCTGPRVALGALRNR